MAQLYNPPFNRLIRSLLLQCVILLGIVSTVAAQTPITYDGPWRVPTSGNVTSEGLSSDGADIAPSTTGGSAQFRTTTAFVDIKLQDDSQVGQTGYRVSYSLQASTTRTDYEATAKVSYRTQDGATYTQATTHSVTTQVLRESVYLPSNATNVRFELASVNAAYVFLDAVEVSQKPEMTGFAPAQGVPGTEVTITGTHLTEATAVYFGAVQATPITKDSTVITVAVPYGAKSDLIRVVTPYGEATSATEFVVPAPEFAAEIEFAPTSAGAGETVTLYGQYFTGVTGVLFNGVAADPTTIVFVNDSEITATVPNGATTGQITIVSPAGQDVSTNTFTVLGPQILAFDHDNDGETTAVEFSPAGGAVGTAVTIYGQYFTAVNEVLFNGVKATFAVTNDNQLTATVPLGASTGLITVKSPAGQDVSTTVFDVPAPTIASFEPTSAGPNMQVTITGTNLSGVSSVMFLGDPATAEDDREGTIVTSVTSDTQLVVLVPADASTGKIQVIAPGEDKVATSEQIFTFVPAPTIASVGTTEGGLTYSIVAKEVTITGTNFETATTVLLGNATIAPYDETENQNGFLVNGDGTAITFNIPQDATTGSVTVKTLGGEATWEGTFEVIHAPVVASIAPTKGPIGQKITITGQHLKYVSEVVFLGDAGTEADNLSIAFTTPNGSDTELVVTVPEGAVTGKLSVINPAGQVETAVFEVIRTPVILAFEPGIGVAGTEIKVTGYNFVNEGGVVSVAFAGAEGTVAAAAFTVISDTELTAVVPAGAVTGPITVTNPIGAGSSETNFTIIQKPTITSLNPIKGTEGSTVVITGTEFKGEGITVTFLGAAEGDAKVAATINVDSETQITATVPVGAVTGKLMVTNAAGASEPSEATYTVVTSPEIISFSPTEGKVADKVTLTGWLLSEVTGVAFNGTTAQFVYSETAGTIESTVPTDATTGPISLLVGEETVFTTTDVFTVIPAPTIVSFTPEQGVAETFVTITGTNFKGLSKVTFLGTETEGDEADADLSALTPEELSTAFTIAVPYGAVTGKIQITATGGTATSEGVFTVPVPANITFTPSTSYANQEVMISGNYFKNITKVTFNGVDADISTITVVENDGVESFKVKAPFNAGTGPIAITTPAGTGTSTESYTVIEPVITSVSVSEGYAGRTAVTINGTNFASYWDETSQSMQKAKPIVRIGTLAVDFTYDESTSDQTITFILPESARSGNITVESLSGISEGKSFTVLAPIVRTITPNPAYAGELITVTGDNFLDIIGVSYNGEAVTIVEGSKNEKEVGGSFQFYAPKAKISPNSGQASLTVTTNSGSDTESFTVHKPIISSVVETNTSANRVYAGIGKTVTITGTRFDEYFNGSAVDRAVPLVTFAGPNSSRVTGTIVSATYSADETGTDVLVVEVPATAVTGRVQVASNSGTGQSNGNLTVIGAPTIVSFSTKAGLVGTTFTITGTNFDDATEVRFLGIEGEVDEKIAVYTVTSPTTISVTVPQDATIGKIAVTTPYNGSTTVTSTDVFRVVKAPIIHDFVAKEGPAGYVVTITGENLIDVSGRINVYFKGHGGDIIPAPLESQINIQATVNTEDLATARQITVTVPNNAITGIITLRNEAGTTTTADATQTTVDEFTVTSPVIIRFEKVDGSIINGGNPARLLERVVVKGYKLTNVGTIEIGSTDVTNFFEVDENSLEMLVPRTASRNYVTITALGVTETSAPEMLEIVRPTITVDPTMLSFKTQEGTVFDVKSYTVTAKNLAIGSDLRLSMTGDVTFQISTTPESTEEGAWSRALILIPDEAGNLTQVVSVRNTSTEVGKVLKGSITNSSVEATTATVTLQSEIVPLPVELIAFNAVKQNNGVLLTWATASEQDNDFFEVEMAEDPKAAFKAVGKVSSKVNNSSMKQDYQFSHKGSFTGTRYYRLKQVDLDGAFEYSKVVAVSADGINLVTGPKVAPNPITPESKLIFTAAEAGKLNVTVVNMNGTRVHSQTYDIEAGENRIELNLSNNLPTGIYILMTEFNGKAEQVKLLKQ